MTSQANNGAAAPVHIETDVLVIGAGGAGMYAALEAARAGAAVVLADRSLIGRGGATVMAQMTVAAALSEQTPDHWEHHLADTLAAGRGLCDERLAALLCEDGVIVTGCNVENAAYPLTICAEEAAVATAVAQGRRRYSAIAIAGPANASAPPCGGCRQILAEFAPSLTVLYSSGEETHETASLETLLPAQFELP